MTQSGLHLCMKMMKSQTLREIQAYKFHEVLHLDGSGRKWQAQKN